MNPVVRNPREGESATPAEEELRRLYREHAQPLYNFAARILGTPGGAAEAVSQVLLSAVSGGAWMGDGAGRPPDGASLREAMRRLLLPPLREGESRRNVREVDLWAIAAPAGRSGQAPAAVAPVRAVLAKLGSVSASVMSLVYFGGLTVGEAARRLSMNPSECRSRLHGALEHIAGVADSATTVAGHDPRFAVLTAASALDALAPGEEPEFAEHLDAGCVACASGIERLARAAHQLQDLLPDLPLPPAILEDALFSLRLATMAGSPRTFHEPAAGQEPPDPTASGMERNARTDPGRRRIVPEPLRAALAGILVVAAAGSGGYASFLLGRLEEQSALIESMQDRQAELVVRQHRLAGLFRVFESAGIVAVLEGSPSHPRLAGKLVVDTAGGQAMLQILNLPPELGAGPIRILAGEGEGRRAIAEFAPAEFAPAESSSGGDAWYRIFPVGGADPVPTGLVAVEARDREADSNDGYRTIMEGVVPEARPGEAGAGPAYGRPMGTSGR